METGVFCTLAMECKSLMVDGVWKMPVYKGFLRVSGPMVSVDGVGPPPRGVASTWYRFPTEFFAVET